MNKDQVSGRVEQAKGKIKEVTGKVTGSEKLEAEGVADKTAGKVQSTYGDVKEKAKDAIKSGADKL
ncbi:CsbD family protein [Variovorax sp. RT4R15]|uniref:CsbD family protein n=1 Tax=Variovorax sp. RT4R15 TaxID=3443737 RepID=UPI003F4458BD